MSVPIWFTFTSTAFATPRVDALAQDLRVGDEQVVADELDPAAERVGQLLPAVPVALGQAVLDR